MSNCTKKVKTDECLKTRDDGTLSCNQTRDDGYKGCSQTRDDSYSKCCEWWPCSWACDALTWISNIVCVLWTWFENLVCVGWEWIKNIVCVAWKYITLFVCVVVDIVSSIFNLLVAIFDAVLSIFGGIFAFAFDLLLSIPFIGRLVDWGFNLFKTVFYAIYSLPDLLLTLFGVMPEKKMKLLVIIQNDSEKQPVVADINVVYRDVQYLINTFRSEMNIRVMPTNLFMYRSAFSDDNYSLEDFVITDYGVSSNRLLDVCCDECAGGDDLTSIGTDFNMMMIRLGFSTNARRFIGYGAPIIAFAVRSYTDGKAGCSLGPLTDYVTVKFNETQSGGMYPGGVFLPMNELTADKSIDAVSDLAHEVAHCCNLPHYEGVSNNLMNPGPPRSGHLTVWQKILIRSSRHVTYL